MAHRRAVGTRILLATALLATALALLGAAPAADDQKCEQTCGEAAPPSRIANEWGGLDHQPSRGAVRDAEQSLGVAASARQKQAEDSELDAIRRRLLRDARTAPGGP